MSTQSTTRKAIAQHVSISLLTALLISCGGGGTSAVKPDPVAPTNPTDPGDSSDPTAPAVEVVIDPNLPLLQTNISQVKASAAWDLGYDGSGVTVAVIDTGVRATHQTFSGRVLTGYNVADDNYNTSDYEKHGTHVAGTIAGTYSSLAQEGTGVATGATILPIRVFNSSGQATTTYLEEALDYARTHGAHLANLSMNAPISDGASYYDYTRAAISRYTNAGGLLVVAAGNDGKANPTGIAQYAGDWGGSVLAVGSVSSRNGISTFSNRAGNQMDYYLVAPGEGINSASSASDSGYAYMSGTSMATPHVTGAAALVWDRWPTLTAKQVGSILLESATDLGAAGVDSVYGHGLLNISAAMSPVGTTSIPSGTSVGGTSTTLADTQMTVSGAFGDSLSSALAGASVLAFDSYDRDFQLDLGNSVASRSGTVDLEKHLNALTYGSDDRDYRIGGYRFQASFAGNRGDGEALSLGSSGVAAERLSLSADRGDLNYGLGFLAEPGRALGLREESPLAGFDAIGRDTFGNPYLGLMEHARYAQSGLKLSDTLTVKARMVRGQEASEFDNADHRADATQVEARWNATPSLSLSVLAGQTTESDTLLGAEGGGALTLGTNTRTNSVGITGLYQISDRAALFGHYTRGRSRIDSDSSGSLRNFSDVQSESYGVGMVINEVFNDDDRLGVAWTRPLRVTSGSAELNTPTGVADDGSVVRSSSRLDLTPSGREQDIELFYSWKMNKDTRFAASVLHQREPGHVADAPSDTSVMFSVGMKW